ncbi:MAG: ATP-binding cassette domain-containing protein [Gemmatimonadota bacterium]
MTHDDSRASTPALEATDVTKTFGEVTALDRASLCVVRGTAMALVGESGSGKTTLLRCFNRMVEPDRGRVTVAGSDVASKDPVHLRRALGYVQQDGGLLPHWSVLRNTALVPWLQERPDATDRARAQLDLVGLPADEFGGRYPRELSGGQRQRAALARALASDPEVLLLDEPFGALDALTRADIQDAFAELRVRLGLTVLLVTHDLDEAFRLADRVAVMRAGRVEQEDEPEVLLRRPATEYVAELLARARLT